MSISSDYYNNSYKEQLLASDQKKLTDVSSARKENPLTSKIHQLSTEVDFTPESPKSLENRKITTLAPGVAHTPIVQASSSDVKELLQYTRFVKQAIQELQNSEQNESSSQITALQTFLKSHFMDVFVSVPDEENMLENVTTTFHELDENTLSKVHYGFKGRILGNQDLETSLENAPPLRVRNQEGEESLLEAFILPEEVWNEVQSSLTELIRVSTTLYKLASHTSEEKGEQKRKTSTHAATPSHSTRLETNYKPTESNASQDVSWFQLFAWLSPQQKQTALMIIRTIQYLRAQEKKQEEKEAHHKEAVRIIDQEEIKKDTLKQEIKQQEIQSTEKNHPSFRNETLNRFKAS